MAERSLEKSWYFYLLFLDQMFITVLTTARNLILCWYVLIHTSSNILGLYDRASWQIPLNKTNRCTEFQLYYWYFDCIYFGQSLCPSSGASQSYNGTGTVYAARWPSATRIRTDYW
jgi:hypothetical protein